MGRPRRTSQELSICNIELIWPLFVSRSLIGFHSSFPQASPQERMKFHEAGRGPSADSLSSPAKHDPRLSRRQRGPAKTFTSCNIHLSSKRALCQWLKSRYSTSPNSSCLVLPMHTKIVVVLTSQHPFPVNHLPAAFALHLLLVRLIAPHLPNRHGPSPTPQQRLLRLKIPVQTCYQRRHAATLKPAALA